MSVTLKSYLKYGAMGCGAIAAAISISVVVVLAMSLREPVSTAPRVPAEPAVTSSRPSANREATPLTTPVVPASRQAVPEPSSAAPSAPPSALPLQTSQAPPQITRAVGLGDGFARFAEVHGPCTGPAGGPLEADPDGTMLIAFCSHNFYMMSVPRGIVGSLTLQYELTGLVSRREAEETALAHAPTDRKKLRAYTDTLGNDVTVYSSTSLAKNLPEPVWYRGHPVGTFAIYLQHGSSDNEYFGAIVGAGVDEDENDPGRIQ